MTKGRIHNQLGVIQSANVVPDSVSWTDLLALLCTTFGLASVRVDNRDTRDFVGHGICEGVSRSDQRRSQRQKTGRVQSRAAATQDTAI
jgi:hypothetical protein